MSVSRIYGDFEFPGDVAMTGTGSLPASSVVNATVASTAKVAHTKVQQRKVAQHIQVGGTDITAKTELVHIAYGAGTVLGVNVATITAPTGGDKAFTVDVKKSTGGGAVATILTGVVTINSTKTSLTTYAGTLSGTPTFIAGDLLEIVVAVSGSTGSQGQGLIVTIDLYDEGS